jgi:CRP-like cAMP-binding protein
MTELSIFKNMNKDEINIFLQKIGARKLIFKKDELVFSHLSDNELTGIILYGKVNVIKYDYNGNKIIIDYLGYNSVIGKPFTYSNDISIVASSDSEILFLDYDLIIQNNNISCNIIDIISLDIARKNERIELLSKKTIREKILSYFNMMAYKNKKKSFYLPMTYIDLANYLLVDRSALMRELKKLKNEKYIIIKDKVISLLK